MISYQQIFIFFLLWATKMHKCLSHSHPNLLHIPGWTQNIGVIKSQIFFVITFSTSLNEFVPISSPTIEIVLPMDMELEKKSSSNSLQTVHGMTSTQRWKELLIHLSYIWLFDAYYLFYLQAAVNFNVFFFFLLFQALSCTIIHADQTNVEFKSWMKTFVKPTDLESMSMKIPRK